MAVKNVEVSLCPEGRERAPHVRWGPTGLHARCAFSAARERESTYELGHERVGQLSGSDLPRRWRRGERMCENRVSCSTAPILSTHIGCLVDA
jgi:hypothetical protein